MLGVGPPRRGALGAPRWGALVSAQRGLLTGRGRSGRQPFAWGLVRWAPCGGLAKGKVYGGEFGKGQPNQRLKLTAPDLGRNCVCALVSPGVSLNLHGTDGSGRRSLAASR